MPNIKQIMLQEANEKKYSRKFIDGYIREEVKNDPHTAARLELGVQLVEEYRAKSYYASKNARVAQLANLDIPELVMEIFIGIAYFQREELFTSVTAQLAGRLHFNDKKEAITTVAEIVAVLCITDAFDINKASAAASLMVQSCIPLSDDLNEIIANSEYLPPMVCIPKDLRSNYDSGYLGHKESLILGGASNHHDGDLCLDVINRMNAVPLRLATDFISTVEEDPTFDLEKSWRELVNKAKFNKDTWIQEKRDEWMVFKRQSYTFYLLMCEQGNQIYLTHRVDKRGRIYPSGYHISTMGNSHKKSMVELANEELVEGVPAQ
jgi:hypothetical protein